MSDFDREAERERLREQYEQDRREREAAEQMSELLLQGATMTNAHCSTCGDPIFRYNGQEFCATCEQPVDRNDTDDGGPGDESDDESPTGVEVATPDDDTRVVFGDDPADATETDADPDQSTPDRPPQAATGPDEAAENTTDRPREPPAAAGGGGDAGVETARVSLVRTLTAFSRRAEETGDPRRAREHLAAAREAAEALAALRR